MVLICRAGSHVSRMSDCHYWAGPSGERAGMLLTPWSAHTAPNTKTHWPTSTMWGALACRLLVLAECGLFHSVQPFPVLWEALSEWTFSTLSSSLGPNPSSCVGDHTGWC